jgi:hypothetical protein
LANICRAARRGLRDHSVHSLTIIKEFFVTCRRQASVSRPMSIHSARPTANFGQKTSFLIPHAVQIFKRK